MKKSSILLIAISAILVLSAFSFVSALTGAEIGSSIQGFLDGASTALQPIFGFILGDVTGTVGTQGPTFFLFAKILVFLLVGAIVFAIADFLPFLEDSNNKWVKWMVVLIFDILAVRFLEAEVIAAIILPYSVVAVAFTAILPFVVFSIAIYKGTESKTFRRLAWLFFAAVFIVLWAVRYDELLGAAWIYAVAAGAALIMIWLDGTIAAIFKEVGNEKTLAKAKSATIMRLKTEIQNWVEAYAKGAVDPAEYDLAMKDLRAKLKKIQSS